MYLCVSLHQGTAPRAKGIGFVKKFLPFFFQLVGLAHHVLPPLLHLKVGICQFLPLVLIFVLASEIGGAVGTAPGLILGLGILADAALC